MNKIKKILTLVLENLLKCFWIFPLKKDHILFLSFNGKQLSDNPLYLCKYIKDKSPEKKAIWVLYTKDDNLTCCDHVVTPKSFKYYYYFCTSKTIITNNHISTFLPVRKNQVLLNTWHGGGCMKRVAFASKSLNPSDKFFFKIQNKKYTAFNSTSEFVDKKLFRDSFHYKGELLPVGMPRNDVLFSYNESIVDKVYKHLNIQRNENTGLILYAPTFRGNANSAEFNQSQIAEIFKCVDLLNKKFNKEFVFLFRAHHTMTFDVKDQNVVIATDYPDMQELLCASDILITDYSSCSYDFSLMKKPIFLFVPDMDKYDKEQGFYTSIDKQPFPYGVTLDDFKNAIECFDKQDYLNKIETYHKQIGCYDHGCATEKTYIWLKEKWK